MRYSYEFKRRCVELYYRGEYPDTPKGIRTDRFHDKIREWVRLEEACGPDALRHNNQNKEWTPEDRDALVAPELMKVNFINGFANIRFTVIMVLYLRKVVNQRIQI